MNKNDVEIVLDILTLATKFGIPAVTSIVNTWESDKPITPLMVKELKDSIKPAKDLFKDLDNDWGWNDED